MTKERITVSTAARPEANIASSATGSRLILGVDGGGSKTAALVALLDESGQLSILGRGKGGPSNLRLAGKELSLASLDQAVNEALKKADVSGRNLDYAVLALAGSGSPDVQRDVSNWAEQRKLSPRVEIIPDVEPVLAEGTVNGQGVALIVGTGSVAIGITRDGRSVTKGGWGHWFGDKGSGYYLGYKALAAVAEASDEIGPETVLSEMVLDVLGATDPREILTEVSASGDTRREVAALAPTVLHAAAANDSVAQRIMNEAIEEAVKLVAAVTKTLGFDAPFPLALAGGVACRNQYFRDALLLELNKLQPPPGVITVVDQPVLGCLTIARKELAEEWRPNESEPTGPGLA
ncbi:MAG: BadF/BadG/BcrA/BcrD ATPase family protein [Lysobacterales bacterium]